MKKIIYAIPFVVISLNLSAAYEDHFKSYFEYCSASRWQLQSGERGGPGGHGFTYIHGLCKDYRSEYPQVIPCADVSPELREKYPHDGVGISLDKNFKNVMWVAVPGRDLMLFGDIENKPVALSDIDDVIAKVNELKVFNDVLHKGKNPQSFEYNSPEYLEAVALDTLGTDYAVNWARELHCVRIPTPENSLEKAAKFLNESNNQYKETKNYEWSELSNNCAHLAINTSHAMGIRKDKKLDAKFIQKLTNMALPSNTFLMFADKTVLKKAPTNRKIDKSLKEKDFVPVQVGSIMEYHSVFPSGEYFKTEDLSLLTLPRLFKPHKLLTTPKKYEKRMTSKNSKLKENARIWIERYEKKLNKLSSSEVKSDLGIYLKNQLELAQKIYDAE